MYLGEIQKTSGRVRAILKDVKTGKITQYIHWNKNLITLVGLTALARGAGNIGLVANEGEITYGAVGNGSGMITNASISLENEIERKAIATASVTDQTLTIETYFTSAEANDTITKFALFGEDASAAADSGTMFNHAAFLSSFVKSSTEDLTVTVEIVFT